MPTKRRKRSRAQRTHASPELLRYLLEGEGDGPRDLLIATRRSGDLSVQLGRRVEEDEARWIDLRDELLPDYVRKNPGSRPAAWWWFDAPKGELEDECEAHFLERKGLLSKAERAAIYLPRRNRCCAAAPDCENVLDSSEDTADGPSTLPMDRPEGPEGALR